MKSVVLCAFAFLLLSFSYTRVTTGAILLLLAVCTESTSGDWRMAHGTGGRNIAAIGVYPSCPDTIYAVDERSFLHSFNRGESWDSVSYYRTDVGAIAVDPFNSLTIFLSHMGFRPESNDISMSTDGGRNWTTTFIGALFPTVIATYDAHGTIYVGTGPNHLYRSSSASICPAMLLK